MKPLEMCEAYDPRFSFSFVTATVIVGYGIVYNQCVTTHGAGWYNILCRLWILI